MTLHELEQQMPRLPGGAGKLWRRLFAAKYLHLPPYPIHVRFGPWYDNIDKEWCVGVLSLEKTRFKDDSP